MKKILLFTTDLFSNLFLPFNFKKSFQSEFSKYLIISTVLFLGFTTGLIAQNVNIVFTEPTDTNIEIGENFSVTVQFQSGAQEITGAQLKLKYNPTVLHANTVTTAASYPVSLENVIDNSIGTINYNAVSFASPKPSGDNDFLTVEFTALSNGNSDLLFFDSPNGTLIVTGPASSSFTKNFIDSSIQVGTINQSPTANFTATPGIGAQSLEVAFNAGTSTDPDGNGTIVSYSWDFGDGSPVQLGQTPTYIYSSAGTYTIELTIEDDGGLTDVITKNITVTETVVNTIPSITAIANQSVNENGVLNLNNVIEILDADNDNLSVTISSISNEPQELQSNNNSPQTDPFPFNASGFLTENVLINTPGSYSSDLIVSPTFGDGGSNGDGSAVYTITISVTDEDSNTVIETFDVTVNDIPQELSASNSVRIEAESYDNQGNLGGGVGVGVEVGAKTVVGFTGPGDFVEYTINVPTTGTYEFNFNSSNGSAQTGTLTINNEPSATVIVPQSTNWSVFGNYNTSILLNQGIQTIRFDWSGGNQYYSNTDYFDVTFIGSINTAPTVSILTPVDGLVVSRGTSFNISGDANDLEDGNISSNISWSSDSDTGFIATPNTGSAVTGVFLEPGIQTLKAFVSDSNSSPLTVTDEINVEVSCPQVAFQSPSEGSVITGTSVTIDVSTVDLLFGTVANPNEHFHFFINPPDVNNIDVSKRISTALNGNQTVFTFDDSSGALAYDGNGNGIIEGANTVVVVAARANHVEFDCVGAKAILNFIVTPAITDTEAPVITLNGSSVIDLNVNDVYVDAGATATDNVDSNVTVNTLGSVDTSIAGQYEITYSATDIAGNTGTAIRTVNVNTTTPFQICIASGSAGLTAFGRTFIGDPNNVAPTGQGFSRANGKKYSGYTGAIAGTNTPDELLLFQKEIYGGKDAANPSLEYNVPVTNGFYQVDLYIAEIYHPASGGRVFDVSLEGNIILDEYDPVNPIKDGISSNQTAITRTYFVNVVDGSIEIGVGPASTDNGKISGFCITEVASANLLPSSAIGNLTAEAGTPVSLGLNINDPENDNLTITINPALPIGLSLDVASKAISGTASIDAIGSYVFNAIISDGNSSPVTEQFQLEITAPANDTSPIIATINDIIVNEGDPISLSVTVTDDINPNANLEIFDISLGGTNTPFNPTTSVNGYTFTGTNGNYILDWTPNQGRSYLARVTANDGVNPSVIEEFTINVAQQVAGTIIANTFNNPIPWYGSSNPQGGLTVAIETAGNVGYIGAGEFLEYLINVETVGAYDITFTAANGSGADGTSTDITILEEGNGTALGTVTVPKKEWNIYDPFSTAVNFTNTGLKTLRLEFNGGVNIQQFVFAQLTATQPPIFTKEITDQSNLVGDSPQGLFIAANDPDGGDVTFSVTGSLPTGLTIDLTTGEISGTILPGAIDNSPYSVIITATDDESETAISSFTWTIEPLIVFPICVNVGNQPSVNAFGKTFASDQYLTSVATAYNKVVSNYSGVVQGSGEEALFQSENYNDPLNYAVPTGDGQFTVELYFAELYIGVAGGGTNLGAGERLFDINVEGSIETSVDLFSEFGPLTAATKTFSVTVTDGVLNIDLDAIADNAKLSGFCIVETSNFVTNAAPSLSIEVVEDVLDCENNGEDFILTASANDAEQGNLDSIIVWKDNVGTIVGTGGTLALTSVIGSATYTAEVQDATPAIVTQSITVNVIANTAPTLEDILAAPVTIEPGETISLSSVAADLEDDDTTLTISWNSDIETNNGGNLGTGSSITPILNVVGNHFITASVTDACGITTTKTTTVVVNTEDVTAPIITLKGANPQIIELGDGYSELGATTNDGSIVTIDASEFVDAVGSYNIFYDANDGLNDAVQIVREVNVVDTSIPIITLNGDNPQIIELGTGYSELGATTNDGSIVTIDASAFVDAVGSYNILYDANDGVNDAVQIVRVVNVVDNVAPIITLNGANPQYISLGSGYTELGAITDDGSLVAIDASAFVDAVGTYNILYTANDGVNDAAQIVRVVNVYEDGVFLTINPVNTNVSIGDSFDVKVLLSTGIQRVNGAEIHLNFDPAILQVSSLTPTTIPFNIPVLTQNFDNTQGTIDYGAGTFTTPFPSGNFEMITVSFTAVGSGNSPINFINPENTAGTVVTANGNVLDGTNNGTVVVDVTPGIEITPNSISSTLFVGETTIVSFDLDSNNETNLPTSANIVITDNATSSTSTWATTPAIGIQGINELVFNTIGLVPGLYTATLTASGINGYDDVSIQVSLQVAELPNLVFNSNNFEFTLDSEEQLSESFELVTSNDSPLPQDLILTAIDAATSQPPTWLILNGANNGFSINTTGLSPGDYSASITASGSNVLESTTTISLTVLDSMPCARVAFETGGNINNSSTYGGGLFITNNSSGNVKITSVSIDLSTAVLPNVVFDPIGTAGDATAQCVTIVSQTGGDSNVGLTIPGNNGTSSDVDCVAPFSDPNGPGGYNVMTLDFNDFEAGETVDIAVDVDPRSIEGFDSAGNAGAISGTELIGSTVTVNYSDGSSATRQLYQVGNSVVNSENFFNPAFVQCDAPSISLEGIGDNGIVNETEQTASLIGPANASIEVLVYGTTLEDITTNMPTDLFEMNKIQSLQEYVGVLDASGQLNIPLNLTELSSKQVYYIVATVISNEDDCGQGACNISNVLKVKIDTEVPVIALTGDNPQVIELGSGYLEFGAISNDGSPVIVDDSAYMDAVGSYEILYDATDGVNDAIQVVRIVNVVDTTKPVITLNGDNPQFIEFGDEYTELGATATDNSDDNVSSAIVIGGDIVETDIEGVYVVTYNVNDASGNAADEVVRIVNVIEGSGTANNLADADVNLALLPDALLSGTVSNGRGTPQAILYDPIKDDYVISTRYNEYGVLYNVNLGRPSADDGFKWQVDWSSTKRINYITFGGTYPNQPQPNTLWRISYRHNGSWIVIEEGRGGWIDSGIYEWGGASQFPIEADALRVQLYSDGNSDLISIHIRGRGGVSRYNDDSSTGTKATLIQYLPSSGADTIEPIIVLNGGSTINLNLGDEYTELGASATDNVDGNLSSAIVIGGDIVDTDIEGVYNVTYDVVDAAGNPADQVIREVIVKDIEQPVILLNGGSIINLNVGDEYTELGATATDNSDDNVSSAIVIGGDIVETDIEGVYVVTYNVNDASGNAADEVVRIVNVIEGSGTANNLADADVNLALLPDALLSGTVSNGRGTPQAILYDPIKDDYVISTRYNEYGVLYNVNLGRPSADDGFKWQVDWSSTKRINYITFGGTYPNQPQPNTLWRISYRHNGSWIVIEEGRGGWIDSGIYEWGGASQFPIEADALRVQLYSDGNSDLISIHIRGRGGVSRYNDDSSTGTKATLIQYLPSSGADTIEPIIVLNGGSTINLNLGDEYTELGASATDNVDGNLSSAIVIGGDIVDTDIEGVYNVTYDVVDAAGNPADQVVRVVNVIEGSGSANNPANADINLALLPDAVLGGTVNGGRGTLEAILYDPVAENYFTPTRFNEYGVGRYDNLGRPGAEDGFNWQVNWSTPKLINYITFGGTYPNQPQPNSMWRISYLHNNEWTILEEGKGGWIDSGIYEWGGSMQFPIQADALRVQVYSDGANDLVSIHLRGRGGVSQYVDDSATSTKATLIQYLPSSSFTSKAKEMPENKMIVYPNPAVAETSISFDIPTTVETIQIFDVTGRLIRTIKGGAIDERGEPVNVQELPVGVYFIKTQDTEGHQFQEEMVIKRQ